MKPNLLIKSLEKFFSLQFLQLSAFKVKYWTQLSSHLSAIGIPESHALQVLAELSDVAEDRLGLGLNVPLLEYLSLRVKLCGIPGGLLGAVLSTP